MDRQCLITIAAQKARSARGGMSESERLDYCRGRNIKMDWCRPMCKYTACNEWLIWHSFCYSLSGWWQKCSQAFIMFLRSVFTLFRRSQNNQSSNILWLACFILTFQVAYVVINCHQYDQIKIEITPRVQPSYQLPRNTPICPRSTAHFLWFYLWFLNPCPERRGTWSQLAEWHYLFY